MEGDVVILVVVECSTGKDIYLVLDMRVCDSYKSLLPSPSPPPPPSPSICCYHITSYIFAKNHSQRGSFILWVSFANFQLPFALRRAATNNGGLAAKVFSLLSVFGGGVFLSTCLLDLLPDAMEGIRNAERIAKYEIGFPVTELLVATGFLFVLIVEQVSVFNETFSLWNISQRNNVDIFLRWLH